MTLPRDDELEDALQIERQPLDEPGARSGQGSKRGLGALSSVLSRRPRRRGLEALAVLGALVLAVAIVLASIRGMVPSGASVEPTITPIPEQVALTSNVTFGTFTLNGKRLKGSPPLLVTLRDGLNTITLTAPPFRPKTCTLVWPGQQPEGSDCGAGMGEQVMIGGRTVTPSLALDVNLGAADLPPNLANSARAAVAAALSGVVLHTTVPRGDYYALREDASGVPVAARAQAPMGADLAFLVPDTPSVSPCGTYGMCGVPLDQQSGMSHPKDIWSIAIFTLVQWTFSQPGAAPLVAAPLGAGFQAQLWLVYDGAGGWQVTDPQGGASAPAQSLSAQLSAGICFAGTMLLSNAGASMGQQFGTGTGGTGDHAVDGCAIQMLPNGGSGGPPAPVGTVIWRFGA
ncbi:MAG TPA: hypothetical protein VF116_17820, partial [Ktedonobacterales bacterium]